LFVDSSTSGPTASCRLASNDSLGPHARASRWFHRASFAPPLPPKSHSPEGRGRLFVFRNDVKTTNAPSRTASRRSRKTRIAERFGPDAPAPAGGGRGASSERSDGHRPARARGGAPGRRGGRRGNRRAE